MGSLPVLKPREVAARALSAWVCGSAAARDPGAQEVIIAPASWNRSSHGRIWCALLSGPLASRSLVLLDLNVLHRRMLTSIFGGVGGPSERDFFPTPYRD
jgi:hypothetical protein